MSEQAPIMEDPSAPTTEHEPPAAAGSAAPPARRRFFLKSLLGATLGGALGYHGHPWILGERQDEVAQTLRAFMEKMRQAGQGPPGRRRPVRQPAVVERPAPPQLGHDGQAYETFLDGLGLRYIRPMEMIRPHFNVRGSVCNSLPPREAWRNIAPALRVADELRQRLGQPVTILSAYRSPEYNAACPGAASRSYHMRNMALDLAFNCAPAEVAKAAEALRDQGFFTGGIGRYPGFTHIDTRGHKADWG